MTTPETVTTPRVCWKLTDANGQTYQRTQWGPGITRRTDGRGDLCGPGWLHFYDHPLLAVLLNPIHADFTAPRLWRATYSGTTLDDRGLKRGASVLTTVEEVPLPVITPAQRACFAILCAYPLESSVQWRGWADRWLSGEDRSAATARLASYTNTISAARYAAESVTYAPYAATTAESVTMNNAPPDLAAAAEWAVSWPGLDGESP